MAEAARSVRHYVSDCLEERHPYDARKAFAGRPDRDVGLVYAGLQPRTVDDWISSLTDPTVVGAQRVRAVRLLLAHAASPEAKVTLLRKGVVGILAAALLAEPPADFEAEALSLLRALCVLPHGCHAVLAEGALPPVLAALRAGRPAAAAVVRQISFSPAGVRWLLAATCPDGFALPAESEAVGFALPAGTLPGGVVAALVGAAGGADGAVQRDALSSLAQLSTHAEGVAALLVGGAVGAIAPLLRTQADAAVRTECPPEGDARCIAEETATVLWNIALEQTGVEAIDETDAPDSLFQFVAALYAQPVGPSGPLLRALTGALSAVYKLLSVKRRSLDPLYHNLSRIAVIYQFIRNINEPVDEARRNGKDPHPDLVAISKNLVQCTHFASEVKAVRDFTHTYLRDMQSRGGTEAFYFRRQLYYSTIWEEEFDASV